MDIEIFISTGNRVVDDNGIMTWKNVKYRRCLVTYLNDTEGAKQEAMRMAEDALSSLTGAEVL